ncbi:MAG: hypothetical protein U9R19_00180 [Bacteroidota bacterium]|nr:hypothetical protein [Bacteroidota bacterium]
MLSEKRIKTTVSGSLTYFKNIISMFARSNESIINTGIERKSDFEFIIHHNKD